MYYFCRFDIVEAYYLYARDYHGGQNSQEYQWLSRIKALDFIPARNLRYESLTLNGKAIYNNLLKNNRG